MKKFIIASHGTSFTPEFVIVGCQSFSEDTMREFFSWYFGDKKKYRFIIWNSLYEAINVYRVGHDVDGGGIIRIYADSNPNISVDEINDLFFRCSEYWSWP